MTIHTDTRKFEGQQLILITQEYLERLIINLRDEMRSNVLELKTHMIEKPLTTKEAADFMRIKRSAFDNRIKSGAIPAHLVHKNGGTPYFFASELQQLIKVKGS